MGRRRRSGGQGVQEGRACLTFIRALASNDMEEAYVIHGPFGLELELSASERADGTAPGTA